MEGPDSFFGGAVAKIADSRLAIEAVERERQNIAVVAGVFSEAVRDGGRLIFVGAGTSGRLGVLDLPLTAGRNYVLTLRLDPFQFDGAPPQTVRVVLDGSNIAELPLQWDESRIGSYTVTLPAWRVREGRNRLELQAAYSTRAASVGGGVQEVTDDQDVAFLFWYLRVEPLRHPYPSPDG